MDALELPHKEALAKNLFVRDDKMQHYYLITVKGERRVDLKEFRTTFATRRLSFANENDMQELLGVTARFSHSVRTAERHGLPCKVLHRQGFCWRHDRCASERQYGNCMVEYRRPYQYHQGAWQRGEHNVGLHTSRHGFTQPIQRQEQWQKEVTYKKREQQ